ncbi:MAG: Gfo/Idh/MocA family oxidoreductase [Saprospiraceae bacterium]
MSSQLNIALLGAGGFANFAAKAFLKIPGVRIVAVTDVHEPAAAQLAREVQADVVPDYPALLADARVQVVYIATPPWLHYSQSKQALEAGKHVICEKPAALHADEAEELAALARSRNLLYVVNLMQRYNPLYAFVQTIIRERWLGDFVHGFFENYASDEQLTPDHWFWNAEKSGGIFIEHGVHFFDMFEGWLGAGKLVSAFDIQRAGMEQPIIDRVQATVLYPRGPVNFYHGFNQPKVLDRQEMRLQFDRGDITLYEWVPVKFRLHGLLITEHFEKLQAAFPNGTLLTHSAGLPSPQSVRGKFQDIHYDVEVTFEAGDAADKMDRYQQLVMSMLQDQWRWILDPAHRRMIDENNAVASLRLAEQATVQALHF